MTDECCMKDGSITPPEDRTYHDKTAIELIDWI